MDKNTFTTLTPKLITAKETYSVRHKVLRKGRPIESCAFDGDDKITTFHLGAYLGDTLVAVASFYEASPEKHKVHNPVQLRGMAVLDEYHKKGYGQQLLEHGENLLKEKKYTTIWMNARVSALGFYTKLGYYKIGAIFEIPLVGEHYVLFKNI
jgi:ribosomal protein S18 acetylase RimI-like enzyme